MQIYRILTRCTNEIKKTANWELVINESLQMQVCT